MWSIRRSWSEVNGLGGLSLLEVGGLSLLGVGGLLLLVVGGELGPGLGGLVLDDGKGAEVAEAEGESRGKQSSKRSILDMSLKKCIQAV